MKAVLGGKGANLAEMTNLGVPVPPGFTIACSACVDYLRDGGTSADELRAEVERNAHAPRAGRRARGFGDPTNPLLVSVRSGAPRVDAGDDGDDPQPRAQRRDGARPRAAERQRALRLRLVSPLPPDVRRRRPRRPDARLRASASDQAPDEFGARPTRTFRRTRCRNLVEEYKALVRSRTGADFPMDPRDQLWGAIEAVWRSWTLKKAVDYRRREQHLRIARHRRQHRVDGVRQSR